MNPTLCAFFYYSFRSVFFFPPMTADFFAPTLSIVLHQPTNQPTNHHLGTEISQFISFFISHNVFMELLKLILLL